MIPLSTGRGLKRTKTNCSAIDLCETVKANETADSNICDENLLQAESNTFKAIYIIGECEDQREEKRITVAIILPYGSFENPRELDLKVFGTVLV